MPWHGGVIEKSIPYFASLGYLMMMPSCQDAGAPDGSGAYKWRFLWIKPTI